MKILLASVAATLLAIACAPPSPPSSAPTPPPTANLRPRNPRADARPAAPDGGVVAVLPGPLVVTDQTEPVRVGDLPKVKGEPPRLPQQPPAPAAPPQPVETLPSNPAGPVISPPHPAESGCVDGTGWDFEERRAVGDEILRRDPGLGGGRKMRSGYLASLEGWVGEPQTASSPWADFSNADVDLLAAPVYGNAAPIENIRPTGWSPEIETQIGGDYWKFSQSVNAHGNFWLSSGYRRYSWRQHPGDTIPESAAGVISSPPCKLNARYLTLLLGGARSPAQRVELMVRGARPEGYVGIRFPNLLGDLATPLSGLPTQDLPAPGSAPQFPPPTSDWVVQRSVTSEDAAERDWMQTYVFDLAPFKGQEVRIRVVDDAREECRVRSNTGICQQWAVAHIDVDHFVFHDEPPPGTTWLTVQERTAGCGAGPRPGPIGYVPVEPALWGMTDVHAHPMANLGFGGHVVWGDPTDPIDDIYDCSHRLLPIAGPGGRGAIDPAASTSTCYVSPVNTVVVAGALHTACMALGFYFGPLASLACDLVAFSATATLLTTPVMRGLRLHGGERFTSGAVELGLIFSKAWLGLAGLIGEAAGGNLSTFEGGLMLEADAWPYAVAPYDWFPADEAWHSPTGVSKTHNHYQVEMIRRAHQGGMRLGVWDVVNSRAFALIADGKVQGASDWQALKDQTDAARRIVAGSLGGTAAIATSPADAAGIVRHGMMAVILGTEVDELGRMRPEGLPWPRSPHAGPDTMQKQVDDLWELGIRKITPVHAANNPIGGAAIFSGKYVGLSQFLNTTPSDKDPLTFDDLPHVMFSLDPTPVLPILLELGTDALLRVIAPSPAPPWTTNGWFDLATDTCVAPGDCFHYLGAEHAVTFRIGEEKAPNDQLKDAAGKWLPPQSVLGKQVLKARTVGPLSRILASTPACQTENLFFPDYATSFGPEIDAHFVAADGHRNALGIFHADGGNDGVTFLRAAMKKGMIIDVDHLSQRMRVEVYALARTYAAEAGWPGALDIDQCPPGAPCGDYPFMGVHTSVRGLERESSNVKELRDAFGSDNESTRTPREIEHVASQGGTIGAFPRSSAFIPPNTAGAACSKDSDCAGWAGPGTTACAGGVCGGKVVDVKARTLTLPPEVENDCDTSSKTFAVKYLWLMGQTRGRGLTFTTDANGLVGTLSPRFGGDDAHAVSTPGATPCDPGKRSVLAAQGVPWGDFEPALQKFQHSGVWYRDYTAKSDPSPIAAAGKWKDPRWRMVVARPAGVAREDRAPRWPGVADHVYFNDHGPELPIHHWYDQDGNRPGAQMFPMKRVQNSNSGWDFNLDSMAHVGLVPDLVQDMRNVGVQWEQLGPLFHGTSDFLRMWQRAIDLGAAHP